jgi:hypothetical protein
VGEVDETPTPTPEAAVQAGGFDRLVCVRGWDCTTALQITHAENPRQDPFAISHTGDYGLFQINRYTWEDWLNKRGFDFETEWMIPERNIAMAYAIQSTHGWDEWVTY